MNRSFMLVILIMSLQQSKLITSDRGSKGCYRLIKKIYFLKHFFIVGAMAEDGKFRVGKFNGQNFSLWKIQMEDYLYQKDLYLPLSKKTKKPTAMTYEEWNLLDRKALRTIRLCLAASVAFNISKETTTRV